MQVLFSLTIISSLLSAAIGAASYGFFRNPAYPGKCAYNDTLIMSPGDVVYLKHCTRMSCDSKEGSIYIVSCGVFMPPRNCSAYYPLKHMNYPDCCKVEVRCDEENVIEDQNKPIATNTTPLSIINENSETDSNEDKKDPTSANTTPLSIVTENSETDSITTEIDLPEVLE